ncbi:MAG: hypothetical protein KGJ44_08100, partial [Betaproteobacteria bacterium]|nr:hypothetical protein [Betaproteobacteria bacterium]
MDKTKKTALLKRMRLFVKNRHVDWQDTALPLADDELRQLEHEGRRRRTQALDALDTSRQLKGLRRKLAARLQSPGAAPAPAADEPSISQAAPLTPADAAVPAALAGPGQAFMATQPPGQAISAQVVISAVPQVLEAMRFLPTQTSAAPAPDDQAASVPGAARSSAEDDPVAAAALCLASGDVVGARDNLRAAIDEGGDLGQLARAWLELLWVLDEKDEFDRAVATFGRHCGAPWTTWRDRALRNDDICAFHATERLN